MPSVRKSPQRPGGLHQCRHARHDFPAARFASSSGAGDGGVADQPAMLRDSCSDFIYKKPLFCFSPNCLQ